MTDLPMLQMPKSGNELLRWPTGCTMAEQAPLWVPNMPLYDWQLETLVAAQQYHSRALLSTNNESGKTSCLAPIFLFSVMAAFPGAFCYATSASERQVMEQLFETQLIPRAEKMGWEVQKGKGKITAPNGSTCLCYKCTSAENVEGFHGYMDTTMVPGKTIYRPVAYFVDECKAVKDDVAFAAARRIDPDFFLGTSTPPLSQQGWFFEGIAPDNLERMIDNRERAGLGPLPFPDNHYKPNPLHDFPKEYWTHRRIIDWNQCPHLHTTEKKQERHNIEKRYGKNSPYVQSMLYGTFAPSGEGNLIFQPEDVEGLKLSMTGNSQYRPIPGDTRAAADATQGGDDMILAVRNGTEILSIDEHQENRTMAQAEYWVKRLTYLNIAPWQFTIDGVGVGKDIADVMEDHFGYRGIKRFMSNNKPHKDYAYYDRYTEILFAARELIRLKVLKCVWNELLIRDCRDRCYVEMDKEKIKAEPKTLHRKRLTYSPDRLDTVLIYLFNDFDFGMLRRGQDFLRPDAPPPPEEKWKFHADKNEAGRANAMTGLKKQAKTGLKTVRR